MADAADHITRNILEWTRGVLPNVPANAKPLSAKSRDRGVDVRLMALSPRQMPRTANPPVTIDLDYLVTVQMDDALAEQAALSELLLAIADRNEFEVVTTRAAAEICASLGIPVAAGYVIRTPLLRTREHKVAPLVRVPLRVEFSALGAIEGRVVGPGDIPIGGAVVSMPGIGPEVRTDAFGYFRIDAAPQDRGPIPLYVRARGVELNSEAEPGQKIVLRLPLEV